MPTNSFIVLWRLPKRNRKQRFEPSEDGFAVWRLYLYSVKLHEQTDGQTYKYAQQQRPPRSPRNAMSTSDVTANYGLCQEKRTNEQESNLVHFSLKMWHLVAKTLTNFLMINWPNFVYLLVDPGFYPPFKFLWSIAVRSPHRMDTLDRHKETNKRMKEPTNGRMIRRRDARLFVRPSLRWSLTHTV